MEELPTLPALIARIESGHPASDPLARLAEAVETGAAVTALADHLVGHFVDAARAAGASWAQIGVALGVSKQAVQQRFVPREPATVADFDLDVRRFSRFTARCTRCVVGAEKIAVAAGAAAVTPTHILIGLFAEPESLAIRALADSGADPDRICAAAVESLPAATNSAASDSATSNPAASNPAASASAAAAASASAAAAASASVATSIAADSSDPADSPEPPTPGASLPFTPASRKVFDLAVRAALSLGHNYIGTEHLLLALVTDPDSEPARLLASFDLTREGLSASVQRLLAEFAANAARTNPPVSPLDPAEPGPRPAER